MDLYELKKSDIFFEEDYPFIQYQVIDIKENGEDNPLIIAVDRETKEKIEFFYSKKYYQGIEVCKIFYCLPEAT
jgi:hypothetical protein